jgi:Pyruvate/2-oxoacid:ferredoxin oxidoreductase delta subunit
LMDAAKGYYRNFGDTTQNLPFNPDFMPEVGISKQIMHADILISLPKFKTHGLTVMTGAIKNSYGMLPGAQKARLHRIAGTPERFHELIVEVFRLRVPDLIIMDAVVGMEGNGPASSELREIGLILASDNAVALDGVVARMMGLDPGRLRFLQKAKGCGLGDFDAQMAQIDGEMRILPNFKLPPLGGEANLGNTALQQLLQTKSQVRPQADPELCTACGACIDHCPVSALTMNQNLPVADAGICITCFCCQEICPEKAMTLR